MSKNKLPIISLAHKLARAGLPLRRIPSVLRTQAVSEAFLLANPNNFWAMPCHCISIDMCYWMVIHSPTLPQSRNAKKRGNAYFVNGEAESTLTQDEKSVRGWLRQAKNDLMMQDMRPFSRLSEPWMNDRVIDHIVSVRGGLEKLPEEVRSFDVCNKAVKHNSLEIRSCPEVLWPELIKQNPMSIVWIPEEKLTDSLCEIAVMTRPEVIDHIKDRFCTDQLLRIAVGQWLNSTDLGDQSYLEALLTHELERHRTHDDRDGFIKLPDALSVRLLEHIESTANQAGFKMLIAQMGDAGTPLAILDSFNHLPNPFLENFNTHISLFNSEMVKSRSRSLHHRKRHLLLKHYGPKVVAEACQTDDHWRTYQDVFGTDRAIAISPENKRLFIMQDLDV